MLSKLDEIKLLSQCALADNRAYVGIRSFKGMSAFGTWLYRIAYNEFYNHTRRHQEEHVEDITRMGDVSTAANDAIDASMTVQEALTRLNDNERVAITLFYIEDQPLKQVSKIMQMPEGSVKSLIHRGKAKMKQFIDN